METKLDHVPVIMSYKSGLELEDIPSFIDSIEVFAQNAKEQYKDQKIKLYFLPEDMVSMVMAAQGEE